jgi:hypothetical protein
MFLDYHKGRDGYKYIQNVKYRIQKESLTAFYLMGKDRKFLNRFLKSKLKERFITGDIIRSN